MTPNFFYFFFNIWVSKKRRILRWFQIHGNNLKKAYLEKVIWQKLVQVSCIEEYKLQFCTLLLLVTFFQLIFYIFLNRFQISVKFWVVLIPIFKFSEVILAFFETLMPYSQETAQNFEKLVLQKCLRIAFYTYMPVNLYNFLKKQHNCCTLLLAPRLLPCGLLEMNFNTF
jgi:hypothetical protein